MLVPKLDENLTKTNVKEEDDHIILPVDAHNYTDYRELYLDIYEDEKSLADYTKQIVKISRDRGKRTSVGGTITKANFEVIAGTVQPDMINSRHVAVDLKKISESGLKNAAENMLSFEMDIFDLLGQLKPERAFYYKNRIETNRERIGKKKVVYSMR